MEKKSCLKCYLKENKKVVHQINVILNLMQNLQRRLFRNSDNNALRGRCQIKFGMTSLFNQPGFTLIELLVVVLIIGILAAVALPQYKIAVAKSRFAAIKPLLADLKAAEEVYYLANGAYTALDSELDLSISETLHASSNGKLTDLFYINLLGNTPDRAYAFVLYCPLSGAQNVTDCGNNFDFIYYVWFEHSARPNQVQCSGRTDLGRAVCKTAVP